MPKYFVSKNQIKEQMIEIVGDDVRHIKKVLRHQPGDTIYLCDGEGSDYKAQITAMDEEKIDAKIIEKIASETEPKVRVTIYQALPKADKMEYLIQKAVELGVSKIVPVATTNCVVKIDEKKAAKKIERWNKIAESAAKQSGRSIIPQIGGVMSFKEAIKEAAKDDVKIIAYEKEKDLTIRQIFGINKASESVSVFIGPEGGYTQREIDEAKNLNIKSITLGKRILRTETVSAVILSIIMYNMGEI